MTFNKAGPPSKLDSKRSSSVQENSSSQRTAFKKPIEIYSFIDPLCPECWALEPIIKKLQTHYGNYFRLIHLIGGKLETLNRCMKKKERIQNHIDLAKQWEKTAYQTGMSCDGDIWYENPISSPYAVSIAIKAAEFQGRNAGVRFLRKIREFLFLEKQNITEKDILMECAKTIQLDIEEFEKDLYSDRVKKAFQCDLKISSEMEVSEYPTLVFFNENVEDAGIKVSGMYPYEVYIEIMSDIFKDKLESVDPPSLEEFLAKYKFVATEEIAVVYDMSRESVEREMKKLVLLQKAERIPVKYGTFWRYKENLVTGEAKTKTEP